MLYNVVLVSAVQQNESAMHIHISPLFWISFPSYRRFLLPEYLPYAGIFHERGQPGLATHSSVNRVLAGKELFLWILKI